MRGRIEPAQDLPAYSWTNPDGVEVSIGADGPGEIVVEWPAAPDESQESWHVLERAVELPLLIEFFERGVARATTWRSHEVQAAPGVMGGNAVFAFAISATAVASAAAPVPLDAHQVTAEVLDRHPEIERALVEYRLAESLWSNDPGAALARLYRAVEFLIGTGGTRARMEDWAPMAKRLGSTEADGLRLHDSLQLARHADPAPASARLASRGQTPMDAGGCRQAVRALISEAISQAA